MESLLKDITGSLSALYSAFNMLDDYPQQADREVEEAIQTIVEFQYEIRNGYLEEVFDITLKIKDLLNDSFNAYFSLTIRKEEVTLQLSLLKETLEDITALFIRVLNLN